MFEATSDEAWTNMLYNELATVRVRTEPAFCEVGQYDVKHSQ